MTMIRARRLLRWVPLAAAPLMAGCLVSQADGNGVLIAHTWGSRLLVVLGIAVSAAATWLIPKDNTIGRRLAALSFMVAVCLAALVAPGWFIDRFRIDRDGLEIRSVSVRTLSIDRRTERWDSLEQVRITWHSPTQSALGLYEKGKADAPVFIDMDEETIRMLLPEMQRLAPPHPVRFAQP